MLLSVVNALDRIILEEYLTEPIVSWTRITCDYQCSRNNAMLDYLDDRDTTLLDSLTLPTMPVHGSQDFV